jgi:hypothetical protein
MGSALADRVAPDALARASDDVVAADVRRKHPQARRQRKVLASRW